MDFPTFLRGWLAAPGRSAYKLAEASGVSQSVIGRYVHPDPRRRVQPTPASLEKLAPHLGLTYEAALRMCGYLPTQDADVPTEQRRIPFRIKQDALERTYDRWMAVMGPRLGDEQADDLFWKPILAQVEGHAAMSDQLQSAVNLPATAADKVGGTAPAADIRRGKGNGERPLSGNYAPVRAARRVAEMPGRRTLETAPAA